MVHRHWGAVPRRGAASDEFLLRADQCPQTFGQQGGIGVSEQGAPGVSTELGRGYPNPFNPAATISFSVGQTGKVSLRIYDLAGREVGRLVDRELPAGEHEATWDGKDQLGREVPAGVYLMQLETAEGTRSRKIVKME